jgi:hypothetical protein
VECANHAKILEDAKKDFSKTLESSVMR